MFILSFLENVCFYDVLEKPVKEPGRSLGPTVDWTGGPFEVGKRSNECEQECDRNPECNNIKICNTGCTLFSKIITKNDPTIATSNPHDCFTLFKTCPGGKHCKLSMICLRRLKVEFNISIRIYLTSNK